MIIRVEPAEIEAAKTNPQVLAQIFERFWEPILNYLLKRTADAATAKDLTQETFIKAFTHLKTFKPNNEYSFAVWLYRIAVNEANQRFRFLKRKRELPIEDEKLKESLDAEIKDAEKEFEQHEDFLKIHAHLKRLNKNYQTVVTLYYFEDMTLEMIAQVLHKNSNTIRTWHSRALKKLRLFLSET